MLAIRLSFATVARGPGILWVVLSSVRQHHAHLHPLSFWAHRTTRIALMHHMAVYAQQIVSRDTVRQLTRFAILVIGRLLASASPSLAKVKAVLALTFS
jgi:hypothetical protein